MEGARQFLYTLKWVVSLPKTMKNFCKKLILVLIASFLVIPVALSNPLNVTIDLRDKDVGDFIASGIIQALAYDTKNNGIYLGGQSSSDVLFAYYNKSSNKTVDLRGTMISMVQATDQINSIAYDSNNDGVYFVGERGIFGYYNKSSNITNDLRATDFVPEDLSVSVLAVAYDNKNDIAYFAGNRGAFGYYNGSQNVTHDLRATDIGDFIGSGYISSVAYDSKNNGVYIAGDNGIFAYYNKSSNTTVDLNAADTGDWISNGYISSIAYDSKNNGVYLIGNSNVDSSKIIGYYNKSANTTIDLGAAITKEFIGTNGLISVVYDSTKDGAYFSGFNGLLGYYSRSANTTIDLSVTDTGNWISTNNLLALAYDFNNDAVYISGWFGSFGEYFSLPFSALAQKGTNVFVDIGNSVSVNFSRISIEGVTTVSKSTEAPSLSTGFSLDGVYYDIETTAKFIGSIVVTLPYDPLTVVDPSSLKLFHFDKTLNTWVDVTLSVDTTAHTVTGIVSSLSPFAIGIPIIKLVGFMPPINRDGSSAFKLGSTIPVKFQLIQSDGNFLTNALAQIFIAKVENDTIVSEQAATSTNSNKSENVFRYDSTDNNYIFNLYTKSLSKGTWRIRVALENGISHTVLVNIS